MKHLFITLAVLVFLLFTCDPVRAYVTIFTDNGFELHWSSGNRPVKWYLHKNGAPDLSFAQTLQVLRASFNSWQYVECSNLSFEYKGVVDVGVNQVGTDTNYDRDNVLIWIRQDDWPGDWVDAMAVAVPLFETQSGEITDADIMFNQNFPWSVLAEGEAGKADLQSIATHEIGHLLGLDHPDDRDATMYYAAIEGEIYKRSLAADDIQGICHIYPVQGVTGFPCQGSGECNNGCDCVEHLESGGNICASHCDCPSDCSPAFTCIDGLCLPPEPEVGGMGADCSRTLPCISDDYICVSGICSIYCENDEDCPDGWECQRLIGGGKACYGSNPDPTEKESLIKSLSTDKETSVIVGNAVTIKATSNTEEPLEYRFLIREYGGPWNYFNDYNAGDEITWAPETVGSFEIRAEVRLIDSEESCYDDTVAIPFTVLPVEVIQEDGDSVDPPHEGSYGEIADNDSGCYSGNPSFSGIFWLFLLSMTAFRLIVRRHS